MGVFVGVMFSLYQLYAAEEILKGNNVAINSTNASIANRVSYSLNLKGPSLGVDTMCSSSLTAIHLACESIRRGECQLALAGGVNMITHPSKYLALSQAGFLSSDGKCKSFGEGGNGYVPSEGVGAVLLKSLNQALRDGDHIYGVIKASGLNHGGYTTGYTVPDATVQADLIQTVLHDAKIAPESISYLEAHGTGTNLGDQIEIRALSKAWGKEAITQSCPLGSVKSNIGHSESASTMAALAKVLCQFKHQQLVPSLHADVLNAQIEFSKTPFYVQQKLSEWKPAPGYRRRAGIHSFGAGGSNAYLVLEEALPPNAILAEPMKPCYLMTLSAKTEKALKQKMIDLDNWLINQAQTPSLEAISYTLNAGRSHLPKRCAWVVNSLNELQETLQQIIAGQLPRKLRHFSTKRRATKKQGNLQKSF